MTHVFEEPDTVSFINPEKLVSLSHFEGVPVVPVLSSVHRLWTQHPSVRNPLTTPVQTPSKSQGRVLLL